MGLARIAREGAEREEFIFVHGSEDSEVGVLGPVSLVGPVTEVDPQHVLLLSSQGGQVVVACKSAKYIG